MNTKQKYVLIGILVVFLLQMIFFTPFTGTSTFKGNEFRHYPHGNLFSPFSTLVHVNIGQFILYWGVILVVGGLVFYIAKDNKEKKKE